MVNQGEDILTTNNKGVFVRLRSAIDIKIEIYYNKSAKTRFGNSKMKIAQMLIL